MIKPNYYYKKEDAFFKRAIAKKIKYSQFRVVYTKKQKMAARDQQKKRFESFVRNTLNRLKKSPKRLASFIKKQRSLHLKRQEDQRIQRIRILMLLKNKLRIVHMIMQKTNRAHLFVEVVEYFLKKVIKKNDFNKNDNGFPVKK